MCAMCYHHHVGNESDDDILLSFCHCYNHLLDLPPSFTHHCIANQQQQQYNMLWGSYSQLLNRELAALRLTLSDLNGELARLGRELADLRDEMEELKVGLAELKAVFQGDKKRKDKQVSRNFAIAMAQQLPLMLESVCGITLGPKERFIRHLMTKHDDKKAFVQLEEALELNKAFTRER